MTKKKCHLKNDKVEHVLLYHFLNDKINGQIVSPGKKKLIRPHMLRQMNRNSFCCNYICVYSKEKGLN